MKKIVNLNSFANDTEIETLLNDLKGYHLKKGQIINQLLNYSGDKLAVKKWHNVALKLADCGTFVEYDTVDGRIARANFCRQRCCPMCQRRRALEIYSRLKRNTEHMFGFELLHVVLTCKNVDGGELSERITQLFSASRKLFSHEEIKRGWKGEVRFLEVTYNSVSDEFHPHLHVLVMVMPSYFKSRYYIKQERLADIWSDIMGENCIAYVGKADNGALAEVAKYCVKPFESDVLDKNIEPFTIIYEALANRRTYQLFGEFKKFNKIFKEVDVLEDLTDVEIINPTVKFTFDGLEWHQI